jgi:hypothetical protein
MFEDVSISPILLVTKAVKYFILLTYQACHNVYFYDLYRFCVLRVTFEETDITERIHKRTACEVREEIHIYSFICLIWWHYFPFFVVFWYWEWDFKDLRTHSKPLSSMGLLIYTWKQNANNYFPNAENLNMHSLSPLMTLTHCNSVILISS